MRPPEDEQEQNGDHGEHDGQEEAQCRHLSFHLLVSRGQRRHLLSAKEIIPGPCLKREVNHFWGLYVLR